MSPMSIKVDVRCKLFLTNGLLALQGGVQRTPCTSTNGYDAEVTAFTKSKVVTLSENRGEAMD